MHVLRRGPREPEYSLPTAAPPLRLHLAPLAAGKRQPGTGKQSLGWSKVRGSRSSDLCLSKGTAYACSRSLRRLQRQLPQGRGGDPPKSCERPRGGCPADKDWRPLLDAIAAFCFQWGETEG